jgi:uncharacterized membrane protein (DUF4010 family)
VVGGPFLQLVLAGGDPVVPAAAADPSFLFLAQRGGVAMLVGLLVGAEREYSHTEKEQLFAGVRTFPIISLLGFVGALLGALSGSPLVFAAASIVFGLLIVASYVLTSFGEDKGATTEIAGLIVYFLGALCWYANDDQIKFASAAAVAATLLLSMREAIHGVVAKFEREDIYATLKLAVVTLIVLPLLKEEDYGPYQAFNPYRTWKYVVLIASISFAGYVAMKVVGTRKGVGLTGIFGGLSSSTAVAIAFSRKSREEPRLARSFASAIVLASTIMFPRLLFFVTVACPPLLDRLWKPVALLTATGVVMSGLLYFHSEKDDKAGEGVKLKNPFELWSAVKFGMVLAVIGFVSRFAFAEFGERGLSLAGALMGLADADGFAVPTANQGQRLVEGAGGDAAAVPFLATAASAILLAMIANTVVKGGLTVTLGAKELRRYTVPAFAAMAVVGVLAAFLLA